MTAMGRFKRNEVIGTQFGGAKMKREVFKLGDILRDPSVFSWKTWIFVDRSERVSSETAAILMDDFDPEFDNYEVKCDNIEDLRFSEFLSIHDISQIRDSIFEKNVTVDLETLVEATLYYFENDAFL